MKIAVASGKGGTGKTTVAVNLAVVLSRCYHVGLLDCDVEEPNVSLFLPPSDQRIITVATDVPEIDAEKCSGCGVCARRCVFNAIAMAGDKPLTFPGLCHGCGGCALFCPAAAVTLKPKRVGQIEEGVYGNISLVCGRLDTGHGLTLPVIKAVKKRNVAAADVVISDAPPGTSCSMVASVSGNDYCLLVTEPTPFGLYDLSLAVDVLKKLQVPAGVVINRCGIGDENLIEDFCRPRGIPVVMRIPFDYRYGACYARGGLLAEEFAGISNEFRLLGEYILRRPGQ